MNDLGRKENIIMVLIRDVQISGSFLTRLPFRASNEVCVGDLRAASWSFPIIGLLIGLLSSAIFFLATHINLNPFVSGMLCVAFGCIVSGGLHEDGLADTCDGLLGGKDAQSKLDIMRDSSIGGYGAIALIFSVGIRCLILGGLSEPEVVMVALIVGSSFSRSLLPFVTVAFRHARSEGLAVHWGRCSLKRASISFLIGAFIFLMCFGIFETVLVLMVVLFVSGGFLVIACSQIGGYSGDILGACQQISEITVLLAVSTLAI